MSLAGYADELRALPIGGTVAKVARVPVDLLALQPDRLDIFRRSVTAANVKAPGEFTTQRLDALSPDFKHAIRVMVTTRTA